MKTIVYVVLLFTGCATAPTLEPIRPLWELAPPKPVKADSAAERSKPIRVAVQGQTVGMFLRRILVDTGVSVVVAEGLENRELWLDIDGQPLAEVIEMMARRLGVEVTRPRENLWYVGALKSEDRGVYVTQLGEVSREDATAAAGLLLTEVGRVHVTQTGLVIVGDAVAVLAKVDEVFETIRAAVRTRWVVQLHLIQTTRTEVERIGAEVTADVTIDALKVLGSGTGVQNWGAFADLTANLSATRSGSTSRVVAEPVYLLNEYSTVNYHRGESVPVQESIAGDRTVSTSTRFVDVGLQIEVSMRGLKGDGGVMSLRVADERVTDVRDGQPVVSGYEYNGETDVESGGVYLLATLETSEVKRGWWSLTGIGRTYDRGDYVSQVWARVYRVGATQTSPDMDSIVAGAARSDLSGGTHPQDAEGGNCDG